MEIIAGFKFTPTKKQWHAFESKAKELLVGGAAGGGKSVFLVVMAFLNACRHPGSRAFLGRKVLEDFKISTKKTWQEHIPFNAYQDNKQDKCFYVNNEGVTSEILYGGFNDTATRDKFGSTEFNFAYIDQAEELEENDILQILARVGRHKLPDGSIPPKQTIFSANPKQCTIRDRFILSPNKDVQQFVQFLPRDNPYLAPGYIDDLKELYKHRPEMYEALVNGSWDILESVNIVIKLAWIEHCMKVKDIMRWGNKCGVSCDPAMYGDDETVIYGWQGSKQIKRDVFGKQDSDFVASRCLAMLKEIGGNWIAVGGGSIGDMVVATLKKICDDDVEIILVGEAMLAENEKRFYNRRAEMYWESGELMADGAVSLIDDPIVKGQLNAHTYKTLIGRLIIDKKEVIKERLRGRSPDFADATCIGLWALARCQELPTKTRVRKTSTEKWIEKNVQESEGVLNIPYDLQPDSNPDLEE